jgi:hypothetical protein
MTEEEQAKQEWEKKSDIYGVKDHPYSEGFLDGIDLYQSALKEAIEKEIKECEEIKLTDGSLWGIRIGGLKKALKLLTTVTPKN